MGQILTPLGGPADAGRALPGFRWTLIPCGDAARPSDPSLAALGFRLRTWRRCALRLPRLSTVPTTRSRPWPRGPGALLAGGMGRLALAGGIVETVDSLRPWATRPHLGSVRRCTRPLPARGHCYADASLRGLRPCLNLVSLAPRAERGKGALRASRWAGGFTAPTREKSGGTQACPRASRPAIRHKAAPCGRYLFRSPDCPVCHVAKQRPETPDFYFAGSSPFRESPPPLRRRPLGRAKPGGCGKA